MSHSTEQLAQIWADNSQKINVTTHILKTRHIAFCFCIGIGYWKDVYSKDLLGVEGLTHNFILPFIRLQLGHLVVEKVTVDIE